MTNQRNGTLNYERAGEESGRPATAGQFLIDEMSRSRMLTDHLFAQVLPEALYDRPIPERHRLLFYLGHLEAFDWNIIGRRALGLDPVSDELDALFAFGIDPPEGEIPQDEPDDWPSIDNVYRYVTDVRHRLNSSIIQNALARAVNMAVEHRLMHAETLTYIIHNLPWAKRLTRVRSFYRGGEPVHQEFIHIPAGIVTLGANPEHGYCWDNELALTRRQVDAFAISKHKVTNGQYLAFVTEGGPPPYYWSFHNGQWQFRGFHGDVPLPLDLPVYVNCIEAEAFARWLGKSLPTEEQFHRAAFGSPGGAEWQFPWGDSDPHVIPGNYDFRYPEALPVTATPEGDSAFGVSQLVGNGWEWTSSLFEPFSGFKPDSLYPEYSASFFDGNHRTVKGASQVTDHRLIRRSFRNWFRDHYRYAYTTFRLVEG
jgi:formylglycine-generating enzyme required for sulfatase activity